MAGGRMARCSCYRNNQQGAEEGRRRIQRPARRMCCVGVDRLITTRKLFAKHSLRCTRQRRAVYETLCDCTSHPTAEELYRIAKPRLETLSLATVYNSLEALSGAGLVRRLPTTNGCCRYDADTSQHLHVCLREDARIVDVPAELSEKIAGCVPHEVLEAIGRHLGVKTDGVSIPLIAARANGSGHGCSDQG